MAEAIKKDNQNDKDQSKEFKPTRFGRYLILDHLVDGGMAKICRARFLGEQADKIVAIKMIRPQYSQDESFKKMFMDEIKVAFGLNHPNIAQTYDYGILQQQLYTAMEYIDGKNLKQYLDKLKERNFIFPVEISTYILAQVCQGLSYAHNFTDKLTGKSLNIIHRDISPHNIMLTYDGAVKIIDFGIAKASTNSEETQAGTIKGKISYLAPEYLEGLELDHRYDQFAVGITLWEMLCGRKLFSAANELATLKKIQACDVPIPSSINPKVHKELDQIVMKALEKKRGNRFNDMEQFNRALIKFLYSHYPDFNATDLNYFARELFKDDIKRDRDKFVEFGRIDITPFLEELRAEAEGKPIDPAKATAGTTGATGDDPAKKRRVVLDLGSTDTTAAKFDLDFGKNSGNGRTPIKKNLPPASTLNTSANSNSNANGEDLNSVTGRPMKPRPIGNRLARIRAPGNQVETTAGEERPSAHSALESAHGSNTGTGTGSVSLSLPTTGTGSIEITDRIQLSPEADANIAPLPTSALSSKLKLLRVAILVLVVMAGGHFLWTNVTRQNSEQRQPASSAQSEEEIQTTQTAAASTTRLISFRNTNPYQTYFIHNKKIEYQNTGIQLPINQNIYLRVEQDGKAPIFLDFQITEDSEATIPLPTAADAAFGMISSDHKSGPGVLSFELEGHTIVYQLPIDSVKVPVGEYRGTLTKAATQIQKQITFVVTEDNVTEIK